MAGTGVETQLQLTPGVVTGQRGTIYLLLGMLAWIIAGFAGAVVAAALMSLAAFLLGREFGFVFVPQTSRRGTGRIAAAVFQGILLLGALRQGRRAGDGDSRAAVLIQLDRDGVERQRVNYRGYKMRRALAVRPYPTGGYAVLFEGAGSATDSTLYLARVDASGRF